MPTTPTTTFQPAAGSGPIAASLQKALSDTLAVIPPEKSGAFLTSVTYQQGRAELTIAAAHRSASGWTVGTWVRTDLRDQLEAGIVVQQTW